MGVDEMPERMGWDEAGRLAAMLCLDPSSALFAALAGWSYPISRETLALYDLFDLEHQANSDPKKGRPKPHHGRPFETDNRDVKRIGNTEGRSREEVVAFLQGLGHKIA